MSQQLNYSTHHEVASSKFVMNLFKYLRSSQKMENKEIRELPVQCFHILSTITPTSISSNHWLFLAFILQRNFQITADRVLIGLGLARNRFINQ